MIVIFRCFSWVKTIKNNYYNDFVDGFSWYSLLIIFKNGATIWPLSLRLAIIARYFFSSFDDDDDGEFHSHQIIILTMVKNNANQNQNSNRNRIDQRNEMKKNKLLLSSFAMGWDTWTGGRLFPIHIHTPYHWWWWWWRWCDAIVSILFFWVIFR